LIEEVRRRVDITKKEKLGYLDLRGLGLDRVPEEILEVPWIGALSLSDNNITDISILAKMGDLHKLALTSNRIEDISVLEKLPKLRFIFLANNCVKDISKLRVQSRLKKLVLNGNQITSIPDLSCFSMLAYLDLSNNPLQSPSLENMKVVLPSLKIYNF